MKQYQNAANYARAIHNKCYWCISREYHMFDCQFMQGTYFTLPCSKEYYKRCPHYKAGELIRNKRGF
uniref:Uncharacterized protein n=1 Tax=viral metagenome TaxID=1070528 RepID=A0A6M3JI27_9ZZZZ